MPRKPRPNAPWIQIAGIRSRAEADLLLREGVLWLGFPLRLAYHAPDLKEEDATRLIRTLPADAVPVLITYLVSARETADFADRLDARAVQIHGDMPPEAFAELRRLRPDLFLIKSLIVRGRDPGPLLAAAHAFAADADAFITDTFDPATGACGATGRVHDWAVSRRLVGALDKPVILAGGLTPENVGDAVRAVHPAGVDTHTGVEDAAGGKDPARVRAFVAAARAALAGA